MVTIHMLLPKDREVSQTEYIIVWKWHLSNDDQKALPYYLSTDRHTYSTEKQRVSWSFSAIIWLLSMH